MKSMIVIASLMLLAAPAFAVDTIPAVGNLTIEHKIGCSEGQEHPTTCPDETTLSFMASTIGICDSFSANVIAGKEVSTLTIVKTTVDHCTRPEHPPRNEMMKITLKGELPHSPIYLGNPLLVIVNYDN